uniref:Ubiquitin-protein ligase n=1 Tax=Candidatus Kentrum sp. TC TaxID=2126339 RepID=A0A450YWT0_9GAMM|nr:MAG: Ubiquitin-protein ligase [Candidatus Kentron sp. TC]
MADIRTIRLKNEYEQMNNLARQGDLISWKAASGTAPYVDGYLLTVKARTLTGPEPSYRDTHSIRVTIPYDYPNSAPKVQMLSSPYVYHPNWYTDGRWCHGSWNSSESLGDFVIRMIKTLFFDEEITNPGNSANGEAKNWYQNSRNKRYLPKPPAGYPDPTAVPTFKVKRKFKVSR